MLLLANLAESEFPRNGILSIADFTRDKLKLTVESSVEHCADEQFSLVQGCHRTSLQHRAVLSIDAHHHGLLREYVLDAQNLSEVKQPWVKIFHGWREHQYVNLNKLLRLIGC